MKTSSSLAIIFLFCAFLNALNAEDSIFKSFEVLADDNDSLYYCHEYEDTYFQN